MKRGKINLFIHIMMMFVIISPAYSQENNKELNNHPIIKDKDGRIITNTSTQVLFFISTDTIGENAIQLNSKSNNSQPLKIINQGRHRLIHADPSKSQQKIYIFMADGESPKTKLSTLSDNIKKNDTIIAASGFEIDLSATDNISGVKDIFYSVNNSSFQKYTNKLKFEKAEKFILKYYSEDFVGNKETPHHLIIFIDNSTPTTHLSIINDQLENIVSTRSLFNLEATDVNGIKETWYWLNDEKPSLYNKPVSISKLAEGNHSFSYYSIDNLGNIEETKTYDFYLDKTPPIIFEEILGNKFIRGGREYSSGRSQLKITAIDNKAGVKEIYYSLNGKDFFLYEIPVFLSMVSGNITIRSYALDNVNNKSFSTASGTSIAIPYVDLNAPEISHSIRGAQITLRDTLFISPRTQIILNATDNESGLNYIIYKISNQEETQYNNPFRIENQGFHSVYYTAFDNVDNANTGNFSAYVDITGPEIKVEFSINSYATTSIDGEKIESYPRHLKVFITSKDVHTGTDKIFYTLNSGKEQEYKGFVTDFIRNSINVISVRSTDILGNESTKEIKFFIE
ncbi:MAG: hypothetical protein KGZ97_03760 [Bacteroidetes bacterium]|nr:hypothetical protein [Bacteroidota bacterium]